MEMRLKPDVPVQPVQCLGWINKRHRARVYNTWGVGQPCRRQSQTIIKVDRDLR
jgi:hypothetical protein